MTSPSAFCNRLGAPDLHLSGLNTQPARTPVNASTMPLRARPHDSGPVWLATPSPYGSRIRYSLPASAGALQKVREAATSLLGEFSKVGPILEVANKDYVTYHKILLDYKLAEQALLTGFESLVFHKGDSADSKIKFLEIKMEDVLISSYKLSEGAQKQLQALAGNMLELANSLLQPGDGTVGLTLIDGTGDVITG